MELVSGVIDAANTEHEVDGENLALEPMPQQPPRLMNELYPSANVMRNFSVDKVMHQVVVFDALLRTIDLFSFMFYCFTYLFFAGRISS